MLFVSDASQELTAAEVRFLSTVQDLCPTVIMILTKIDLYPHWEQIRRLDLAHLDRRRVAIEVLPLSSEVRRRAARANDQEMNEESGFPPLVAGSATWSRVRNGWLSTRWWHTYFRPWTSSRSPLEPVEPH